MKKLSIVLSVLFALVVGGIFLVPVLLPLDSIALKVKEQVKLETGRDLDFRSVKVVFWPNIGVGLTDVTLSNPAWAKEKNMVVLGRADVALALKPLLRRQVEISHFTLESPAIYLETGADGKRSWDFSKEETSAETEENAAAEAEEKFGLRFGLFQIRNGKLSFTDQKSGNSINADDIDADVIFPDLKSSLQMKGEMTYRQKRAALMFMLEKPAEFMRGNASPGQMNLKTEDVSLKAGGAFALQGEMFNGNVEADVPSFSGFMAWLGDGKPKNAPFEKVSFTSATRVSKTDAILKDAALTLDEVRAKGNLNISFSGKTGIFARLSVNKINLDRFTGGAEKTAEPGEGASAAEKEWDKTPIDLSGLKSVNADVELKTEGFSLRGISAGPSVLTVMLQGGNLNFKSSEAGLQGGKFKSEMTVNAYSTPPSMSLVFDMDDVQVKPILSTFASFKKLDGAADAHVSVTSSGASQKSLISNLDGKGSVTFKKGSLEGIDLASVTRFFHGGNNTADVNVGEGKTDFIEMGGTFTVSKGIVSNADLKMKGSVVQATGNGNIDLPKKYVQYHVIPVLKTAAPEKTGEEGAPVEEASGLSIPLNIKGPFDAIKVKADFKSIVKKAAEDPKAALKEIKSFGKDSVKALKNLLNGNGLFGKPEEPVTPPEAEPAQVTP